MLTAGRTWPGRWHAGAVPYDKTPSPVPQSVVARPAGARPAAILTAGRTWPGRWHAGAVPYNKASSPVPPERGVRATTYLVF